MYQPNKSVSMIVALIVVSALAGCASSPSHMQQVSNQWIGQPVSVAFQTLGRLAGGSGPSGGLGGSYQWFRTELTPPKRTFVQTGTEYVGSNVLYLDGQAIKQQDYYEPVGHYEMKPDIKYLCDILIQTNQADVITHVSLAGCADH
jgi:hypothetical protein